MEAIGQNRETASEIFINTTNQQANDEAMYLYGDAKIGLRWNPEFFLVAHQRIEWQCMRLHSDNTVATLSSSYLFDR